MTIRFHDSPGRSEPTKPRPARGAEVASGFKDEEEDGVEFDPKRDISKKDWERMKGQLEKKRAEKNWWHFSYVAMYLCILFPERKAELNLNEAVFSGIKSELVSRRGSNWVGFSDVAMNLLLIFPDRKSELELDDEVFGVLSNELEKRRGSKNWAGFGEDAMALLLFFPSRRSELNFSDDVFDEIKDKLEASRERDWWNFSVMAMYLFFLFPDRKDEIRMDGAAFNGMKDELFELRRMDDMESFSDMATHLYFLAAERVQITENGIVVTSKKPRLSREPKPLPVRSNIA